MCTLLHYNKNIYLTKLKPKRKLGSIQINSQEEGMR